MKINRINTVILTISQGPIIKVAVVQFNSCAVQKNAQEGIKSACLTVVDISADL